jgi:DNA polymerase-4
MSNFFDEQGRTRVYTEAYMSYAAGVKPAENAAHWKKEPFPGKVMVRSIIHLNIADFAVAVECAVDSRLKGRPVIIAPTGAARATVYDMSQEAYLAGIRKGMALRRAVRLCKDARLLPPHPDRYERAMRTLFKLSRPYSPLIESGEIDGHLFMDVSGTRRLFGPAVDIAWRLRRQVKQQLGLEPIWSVAPNKLMAKVATRLVKPDGQYIVSGGEIQALLAPLPVSLLPGIEGDDLLRLREFNLTRVRQLSALSLEQLKIPFRNRARFLYETARGIDPSPVLPADRMPPRAVADHEFGTDTNDRSVLQGVLYGLVEQVGEQLRQQRRAARRLSIMLDHCDGGRCVRQLSVRPATANDFTLFKVAQRALSLAWTRRVRIRHVRLICDRLTFPPVQLELFAADQKKTTRDNHLISAIDDIRRRFGHGALQVGRTLAA